MSSIELDYRDVTQIIKESLKIENSVKSIKSIFLTQRYFNKINYKPYFQRNYVWDDEKATYFIESILLGTEIPPLVLFQTKTDNEVIDGRQRYETITRFLNDKFALKDEGLKSLKALAGKKYTFLDPEIQERFETTRLRILQCSVVNEPSLSAEREDKIKKEIFKRYNSGITSLQKEEIERAAYINDEITLTIYDELDKNENLFNKACALYLPKSKFKAAKRDKLNVLLTKIRTLLSLHFIPIYSYAHGNSKIDIVKKYYHTYIFNTNKKETLNYFISITDELFWMYEIFNKNNFALKENKLLYEVLFWLMALLKDKNLNISKYDLGKLADVIMKSNYSNNLWQNIKDVPQDISYVFEPTGSHYYKSIMDRYQFIVNCGQTINSINLSYALKDNEKFESIMNKQDNADAELKRYKLNKGLPESVIIDDIISDMKNSKFLIRPSYQRSEIMNLQKASYLMESIILGIQIPPIYIYKRNDGIKEVIDGQQRILTILGFLGKSYIDETGKPAFSNKNNFRLAKLRIMSEIKSKNFDSIDVKYQNRILDFPIDIIEIDETQNPEFNQIDLFLRLNTKPYPIKNNTFEMWNAYIDKDIILKIKYVADLYSGNIFRKKDPRMKVEELITTLAYLEYRTSNSSTKLIDCLNIYKRNGRINARITNKESVTKLLSDASNTNSSAFISSISNIENFAKKIGLLVDNNISSMPTIFSHKIKGVQYKTDQNFYLLWAILRNIDENDIRTNRDSIIKQISNIFAIAQKIPDSYDIDKFINSLDMPQ